MTAKLVYFTTQSLDGRIEDEQGKIDWAGPDAERQAFINDALRPIGTHLYGRRMYETMQVWNELGSSESDPAWARDFGGYWRIVDKVIYSRTLKQVSMQNARLEHAFGVDAVREMKARATRDLVISGHELAAHAFEAGLVDELKLFIAPVVLGAGKKSIPDGARQRLELVEQRLFKESGIVYVHYRVPTGS